MKVASKNALTERTFGAKQSQKSASLDSAIEHSWQKIAPMWPLKNMIAVNPISGFDDLPFEEALRQGEAYFQQSSIPEPLKQINTESIKWLKAFFDAGQSTLKMPFRSGGLLKAILSVIEHDKCSHKNDAYKLAWLKSLPPTASEVIFEVLLRLDIQSEDHEQFLSLMLTTLPGWAAYVQYRVNWNDADDAVNPNSVTHTEYLAVRLLLTYLIWPEAKGLLSWSDTAHKTADASRVLAELSKNESDYQAALLRQLDCSPLPRSHKNTKAQLVFCIDVRSEPFRRAIEQQDNYETFGCAGFFGLPVSIENAVTDHCHASCPVLIKPAHTVVECASHEHKSAKRGHSRIQAIKTVYRSMKYAFTTPFSLVEAMGIVSGLSMGVQCLAPGIAAKARTKIQGTFSLNYEPEPLIDSIPFEQQVSYGAGALRIMGLTEHFAPLVVFCGHGSTTQNNAFATALDCGACGGRHGAPNARILAKILNKISVRTALKAEGINIPESCFFAAGEHNTTTDAVTLYAPPHSDRQSKAISKLTRDLDAAREANTLFRSGKLSLQVLDGDKSKKKTALRAQDWAQVRPEWGLARNASFIIGPRTLTREVNLDGRTFLHSYNWTEDMGGSSLTTILTAPVVVAHWINAQYLFSTLDNVAFGAGNKTTKNITGKMGIMQGNASDLMHGLPHQSVFKSDSEAYHIPMRLTVIVYAPKMQIDTIIKQHAILQKLFGNGWVYLICHDPTVNQRFRLNRELCWED